MTDEELRQKYDTKKFTDRELYDELNNQPPRNRSENYLRALRSELQIRQFKLKITESGD